LNIKQHAGETKGHANLIFRSRSEINASARRFARVNLPNPGQFLGYPWVFFDNMQKKLFMKCWSDSTSTYSDLPGSNLRSGRDVFVQSVTHLYKKIALYSAGFPCTPYSCLNNRQLMLQDPNAQQMWRCLQNIEDTQPGVSWMQTVGIILCNTMEQQSAIPHCGDLFDAHMVPRQLSWPSWRMCWDLFVWWTRFSLTSKPNCRRLLATVGLFNLPISHMFFAWSFIITYNILDIMYNIVRCLGNLSNIVKLRYDVAWVILDP
jgi:hypothetical protein